MHKEIEQVRAEVAPAKVDMLKWMLSQMYCRIAFIDEIVRRLYDDRMKGVSARVRDDLMFSSAINRLSV